MKRNRKAFHNWVSGTGRARRMCRFWRCARRKMVAERELRFLIFFLARGAFVTFWRAQMWPFWLRGGLACGAVVAREVGAPFQGSGGAGLLTQGVALGFG